jgi:hypothetical protein
MHSKSKHRARIVLRKKYMPCHFSHGAMQTGRESGTCGTRKWCESNVGRKTTTLSRKLQEHVDGSSWLCRMVHTVDVDVVRFFVLEGQKSLEEKATWIRQQRKMTPLWFFFFLNRPLWSNSNNILVRCYRRRHACSQASICSRFRSLTTDATNVHVNILSPMLSSCRFLF